MNRRIRFARSAVPLLAGGLAFLVLTGEGCDDCTTGDCGCTDFDGRPPYPPTGVTSITGDGAVHLEWIASPDPDVDGYRVYLSEHPGGPFTPIGDTPHTAFTDLDAVNGQTVWYAVTAFDQCGNESDFADGEVFDTPRPEGFDLSLFSRAGAHAGRSGLDLVRGVQGFPESPGIDLFADGFAAPLLLRVTDGGAIQDAGFGPPEALGWAPVEGWSPTGSVEAIEGHNIAVRTADGYNARIHVTRVTGDRVIVDWAVQLDRGNRELSVHGKER